MALSSSFEGLTFDNSPPDMSYGVLLVFTELSPKQLRAAHSKADKDQMEREIVKSVTKKLVSFFGSQASKPLKVFLQNWSRERWTSGCVNYFPPGAVTKCFHALRVPIGRIFFAGTETSDKWVGYMDGAVRAGERVAGDIEKRSVRLFTVPVKAYKGRVIRRVVVRSNARLTGIYDALNKAFELKQVKPKSATVQDSTVATDAKTKTKTSITAKISSFNLFYVNDMDKFVRIATDRDVTDAITNALCAGNNLELHLF